VIKWGGHRGIGLCS